MGDGVFLTDGNDAKSNLLGIDEGIGSKLVDNNEKTCNVKPSLGMVFNDEDELRTFYSGYARSEGFSITTRSSNVGPNGKLKYITLACARSGKRRNTASNALQPRPSSKTECEARINATLCSDGKFKLSTVLLQHNHTLSPGKSRYYKSNRKLEAHVKRRLELNDEAGISVNKNFFSFVIEAGGYENLTFGEKDCRNYLDKARRLRLGIGDADAIRTYFSKMQNKNSNFFYVMDLDDDCRLRNVFWADARSRAAYESFGDVVTFDTTYLTNRYDMPFAPFVGINHHGQSVLLGCGLLSNEDIPTFVWLFETWLTCMSGRAPNAIITDQCKAMKRAIEIVFPNSRHRWCLWHIMKKIPEKLSGHSNYHAIKSSLQNAVYDTLTEEEFEACWYRMLEDYDLTNSEWLGGLYMERHRWVPAFVKSQFWAGMSTTQRSESMNAFFDKYVTSKTTLKQFVEQYEHALRDKSEKESRADYASFNKVIPCITNYDIEKQFQEAYTNAKFKEFQEELREIIYCRPWFISMEGAISTYEVIEDVKVGSMRKDLKYTVWFNEEDVDIHCICRLFESRGILCRHAIALLTERKVDHIPTRYLLDRWRKNVKRKHTFVCSNFGELHGKPWGQRFDKICEQIMEIAEFGAESEDKCVLVLNELLELKDKLTKTKSTCGGSDLIELPSVTAPDLGETVIKSPNLVRSKGRPPFKRKISKVDQIIRKKRDFEKRKRSRKVRDSSTRPVCELGTQDSVTAMMASPIATRSVIPLATSFDHAACGSFSSLLSLYNQTSQYSAGMCTQPHI